MRSVWKGPFIDNRVLNEIYELHKTNKKNSYKNNDKVQLYSHRS